MSFLERYKEHHLIELDLSKAEAINVLRTLIQYSRNDQGVFTKEFLNGERLELSEDTLVIHRKNAFFDPFRGHGKITMSISEKGNDKSNLRYEVVPFGDTIETGLYLLAFVLAIWTVASIVIAFNFYTVLTVLLGWLMIAVVVHLALTWNKNQLKEYAISFIHKNIQTRKKATPNKQL